MMAVTFIVHLVNPFARGPARSRVFEDIIREAIELADAGFQEVVLTGVIIGTCAYEEKRLVILSKIYLKNPQHQTYRISSIEPTTIPKDIIEMMRDNPKLCRHLHILLQVVKIF